MTVEMISHLLEALMILCFGLSWPLSIYKSWTSRTAKGKSLYFEVFIWIGYIFGIANKFISYMNNPDNYPLQTYLQSLLQNFEQLLRTQSSQDIQALLAQMDARTGRAAQLFLGAIPVMVIYPFLQKYFTKGLVLGSVKG